MYTLAALELAQELLSLTKGTRLSFHGFYTVRTGLGVVPQRLNYFEEMSAIYISQGSLYVPMWVNVFLNVKSL